MLSPRFWRYFRHTSAVLAFAAALFGVLTGLPRFVEWLRRRSGPVIVEIRGGEDVAAGGELEFECEARAAGYRPPSYRWHTTLGRLQEHEGAKVVWRAPDSAGIAVLSVVVTDSAGRRARRAVKVRVSPVPTGPRVETLEIAFGRTVGSGRLRLTYAANDPVEARGFGEFDAARTVRLVLEHLDRRTIRPDGKLSRCVLLDSASTGRFGLAIARGGEFGFRTEGRRYLLRYLRWEDREPGRIRTFRDDHRGEFAVVLLTVW